MSKLDRNTQVMLWVAYLFGQEAAALDYEWPPSETKREQAEHLEALAARGIEETFRKAGINSERARQKAWREAVESFAETGKPDAY
jgi:hypothetical protein